jgi:hypothetical protein
MYIQRQVFIYAIFAIISKLKSDPKVRRHNARPEGHITWTTKYYYGYRARLECGRSWVRAPIGSNQRLLFCICCFSANHAALWR